ncbi:MAG: hypothetical protein Q9186_005613 [Xanthomendoza sp. 1 TL-2023]
MSEEQQALSRVIDLLFEWHENPQQHPEQLAFFHRFQAATQQHRRQIELLNLRNAQKVETSHHQQRHVDPLEKIQEVKPAVECKKDAVLLKSLLVASIAGAVSVVTTTNPVQSQASKRTKHDWSLKELYGLGVQRLNECNNSSTTHIKGLLITTLKAYTTIFAQKGGMPENLKIAFDKFMVELKKDCMKPSNKDPWSAHEIARCALLRQYERRRLAQKDRDFAESMAEKEKSLHNSCKKNLSGKKYLVEQKPSSA